MYLHSQNSDYLYSYSHPPSKSKVQEPIFFFTYFSQCYNYHKRSKDKKTIYKAIKIQWFSGNNCLKRGMQGSELGKRKKNRYQTVDQLREKKKLYSPLPGVIRLNPTYLRSQRKQEYHSNNYFLLFQSENYVNFLLGHQICRTLVGGWKSQKIQVSYAAGH